LELVVETTGCSHGDVRHVRAGLVERKCISLAGSIR
jgi:hypothetical protein